MDPPMISPDTGTKKNADENCEQGHEAEQSCRSEYDREAERLADLELESELVVHGAAPLKANEGSDSYSPTKSLNDSHAHNHSTTPVVSEKEPEKSAATVKRQSRLVQPQNRLIHTAPQGGAAAAPQPQSTNRPSTAMPKPTATANRSIKPPAPRPVLMSSSRDHLNKKPTTRTQSQQPRPSPDSKPVSQCSTPKVNRKVVTVSSKIGSFTDYKPSGGNVQIFSENRTYNAQSKIGSLNNITHTPGGGQVKIPHVKVDFKEKAKPKIDAKSEYVPMIPEKKILSQKLNWNAQSKVGSLENAKHKPGGGNVQILDQKLEWHATSKVGSRDNINHKPGGGNVQIFDERIQYVSSTNHRSNSGSLGNVSNQSRTASRTAIDLLHL